MGLYQKGSLGYSLLVRVLIFDNNDSFTRNLEHLLASVASSATIAVVPYGQLAAFPIEGMRETDFAVISPGPGAPEDYPGYGRVLEAGIPVLGVCLGMQIINAHFGGSIARLPGCVHGKTSRMQWRGVQWTVARYHSLWCADIAEKLTVEGALEDGTPMVVSHPKRPIMGLQFHPESFLTRNGKEILAHALDSLHIA